MLIWGDGRSNICVGDGLNDLNWSDDTRSKFQIIKEGKRHPRQFNIIATNPPFAGDISAEDTLSSYRIAHKTVSGRSKRLNKVSRDILFIERSLDSLAPCGRMAIVLPRGILKNYTDERVRRFILERSKVRAVVSLTGEMFKPFTNTKTCVLFVEKREKNLSDITEAKDDPEVLYAVCESPGKDRSGRLIRDKTGKIVSDLDEIAAYLSENIKWGSK